jgi:hypothetical protein
MLKLAAVVLVGFGFLMAHEPTRARMAKGVAPVLERLGPAGKVAMRPIDRFTAHSEVDFLADQVKMARELGREAPTENNFQDWVARRTQTRAAGNDPWGAPYYFHRGVSTFTIGSMGPDGKRNTPDDVTVTGPF